MMISLRTSVCFAAFIAVFTSIAQAKPNVTHISKLEQAATPEKVSDGVVLSISGGFLKVELCTDDIVRVLYARDRAFFTHQSLAAAPKRCAVAHWQLATVKSEAIITTWTLKVHIDLASGAVSFFDIDGKPVLVEKQAGRKLEPAEVQGEQTFHVQQEWQPNKDESLYGLGQHQLGLMDIKGYDLDLWQHNGTVVVPFMVSSRGYGLFWDNPSYTRFGDLRNFEPIPAQQLFDKDGKQGALTGSYFQGANFEKVVATRSDTNVDIDFSGDAAQANRAVHSQLPEQGDISARWEGEVEARTAGEYLFQTYSNGGIKLWIDDQLVIDHWRQFWLPWKDIARIAFSANTRHKLRIEWSKDQAPLAMKLFWKTPSASDATSLWSEVADGLDYYFVYGPKLDQVIFGYRRLTGVAPMMPKWALGLWQSRQRYETAQASLDILEGYRARKIPIDNIVQDWFYWKEAEWGSHKFDPARFPDPDGWIRTIHDKYHAHVMISVWPKFYKGTENFEALNAKGYLYQPNLREGINDWLGHPDTFYDAFNPGARNMFWAQIKPQLFDKHIDAWWLDATEPDLTPSPTLDGQRAHVHPTFLGTGARVLNAYSLMNSSAVYDGQRAVAPNQRVFILTRSGFAGQQRYGAAVWSGDISSTWAALRKQISAGVGFSLSGLPYWSMDIGGFSVPGRFSRPNATAEDLEEWYELNTRWFQFGSFVPLVRLHGELPFREPWAFGGDNHQAYQTIVKFDKLRYRLLPYVYSLAGAVTREGGTIMRGLVMDFPADVKARTITDQFMFGPAFLVNPVTAYKARTRAVYLPVGSDWYDFWTGVQASGGKSIEAPAAFDSMPLYIRAGSIIPVGPELQYTDEKSADPITVYVYAGANGVFSLYEDSGLTYDYERGALAVIPMTWDDITGTLTIGKREGAFDGMLASRTFNVVLVARNKPLGFAFDAKPDKTVTYSGEEVAVKLR